MRTILGITVMSALVVFKAGSATGVEPGHDGKPVTIVAFGDSTTAPRGSLRTYADCLRSDLPGKGLAVEVVFNAGVGGNSTEGAKARFAKDVLDRHPDIAVIQFGINDSTVNVWAKPPATQAPVTPDQYAANLTCFIEALRKQNCAVILMTPNPMRWTPALTNLYGKPPYRPADPDGLNETLRPYAERVRAVARTNNVPVVDVYAAFQEYGKVKGQLMDDLLLDGMHPNDKGHRLIADLLMGEIMKSKVVKQNGGTKVADAAVLRLKLLPPGPNNPRNSEGDFVQLKDGRILFIYTHFTGTTGDDGAPCYLAGRYSSDGGRTWTTNDVMIVPSAEARTGNIMSVTLLRLQDGRIVLFYLRKNAGLDCRPVMRVSTDEAQTWSAPQDCISEADVGYYVLNNDRVVQLKSGRLVMPLARHDDLTKTKFDHHPRTLCYLSDDNGLTWRRSKTVLPGINSGLQEPGVVELKDGRLMMFCRGGGGYVYRSFSSDGGDTWSTDERYPGIYAPLSAPAIERIPKTGDLLMVWNNHEGIATNAASPYHAKRTPYNVAISRDEGQTWENIKTLEDDPTGWYCYTALEFVGDDVLLAHCAGNLPKPEAPLSYDTKLAITQITRFSVDWLYAGAPAVTAPFFRKGQRVKVFVLTGQSNSLGTTGDPKETDITPGKDPLDETIPFFWANRSTRAGDGPAVQYGDSGGKIVTLRAQQGEGVDPLFWGPEIGFGRTLAAAGLKDFMIVKASRGGGGNGYWLKGSSDDHMYRHVVSTVQQAVKELPKGTQFDIAALLYNQGESDVYPPGCAAEAGQRLRTLAANLRKDLPNAAAMKVVIGGIAADGEGREVVRSQQMALPAIDPTTFKYVETWDLRPQRYDGMHFNKPAKLELGRRLAQAWLEWK